MEVFYGLNSLYWIGRTAAGEFLVRSINWQHFDFYKLRIVEELPA